MANNNTVNDKLPVQFILPDGDIAIVPTWDYIMDRMENNLSPTIDQLSLINASLVRIDTKLSEWVDDNG